MEFKINTRFKPFLNNDTPRQIFYGGSSSGKSVFLAQRAILDVLQNKRNYLIARNVEKSIKKSTFNEICKVIDKSEASHLFRVNQTTMTITCKNGYQILFCGLDNTQKLKSITPVKGVITDIWLEESTETEYNDYKELTKRLRGISEMVGNKRITLSFNPVLQSSWIYKEFFGGWKDEQTEYQDENLIILKTTYKDNKFLTKEDIEDLENEKDEYYKQVYTLGNWGVLGSVIFKNWKVMDCSEIRKIADNFKNGLDFGYSVDPNAIVRTHYDRSLRRIYILDEFYEKGLTNDKLAIEIKRMIKYDYITCDSSEPKSIQELKDHGVTALPARKGKDSVNFGIQWLQQQEIIIDISCQNAKNEFQQYKWQEDKNGNALKIPIGRNDHIIDALRYAYESEARSPNKEPLNLRI